MGLVTIGGGCANSFRTECSCWSHKMGASSSGVIPNSPAAESGWIWELDGSLSEL